MKWLTRIVQAIIVLSVPLVLLVGSARLLMLPVVMQLEYQRPNFEVDYYGFTTKDRLIYAPLALTYLLSGESIEFLARQTLYGEKCFPPQNTLCPLFQPNELKHMEDVKAVTNFLFALTLVIAISSGVAAYLLIKSNQQQLVCSSLIYGAIFTVVLIITVAIVVLFAWDTFFATFHSLFFTEGTWTFYYSDTLIRLYPEQFWIDMSLAIGVLTLAGSLIVWFIAARVKITALSSRIP